MTGPLPQTPGADDFFRSLSSDSGLVSDLMQLVFAIADGAAGDIAPALTEAAQDICARAGI
jgi:hypothetical protein